MHLTFACREGGGGWGGEDDLGKAKAAQRRGAQLVNTLADASPLLTTAVCSAKQQRTVEMAPVVQSKRLRLQGRSHVSKLWKVRGAQNLIGNLFIFVLLCGSSDCLTRMDMDHQIQLLKLFGVLSPLFSGPKKSWPLCNVQSNRNSPPGSRVIGAHHLIWVSENWIMIPWFKNDVQMSMKIELKAFSLSFLSACSLLAFLGPWKCNSL